MRRIRSEKILILGMPKAPQGNIQGISKLLSLGMPGKASLLSSPTLSVTSLGAIFLSVTSYVVLLGVSFYFVEICLLLFRIMFFISYFKKSVKHSPYHAYVAILYVSV